jgi:hypothetical protein
MGEPPIRPQQQRRKGFFLQKEAKTLVRRRDDMLPAIKDWNVARLA